MSAKFAKQIQRAIAKKYRVKTSAVKASFAITPTLTQTLNRDLHRGSAFLGRVTIQQRRQQTGKTLKISDGGPITKTNDTKGGNKRRPATHDAPFENEYQMRKMHTDFMMHDDDVADWSEFPNYQQLYRAAFQHRFNADRQMIGFHGESWVADSDLTVNPLMEDVNIGWLKQLKDRNPGNYFEGDLSGEVKIGIDAADNYANLDAYVHAIYQMIPMHRRTPGMVVIVGEGLLAAAEGRLYTGQGETPTEKRRIEERQVIGTYGGLPAMTVDYFPDNGVLITNLANLAIYYQRNSWKRYVRYEPDFEWTVDYNARREAYHIRDLKAIGGAFPLKVIMTQANNFEILPKPLDNWAD